MLDNEVVDPSVPDVDTPLNPVVPLGPWVLDPDTPLNPAAPWDP